MGGDNGDNSDNGDKSTGKTPPRPQPGLGAGLADLQTGVQATAEQAVNTVSEAAETTAGTAEVLVDATTDAAVKTVDAAQSVVGGAVAALKPRLPIMTAIGVAAVIGAVLWRRR